MPLQPIPTGDDQHLGAGGEIKRVLADYVLPGRGKRRNERDAVESLFLQNRLMAQLEGLNGVRDEKDLRKSLKTINKEWKSMLKGFGVGLRPGMEELFTESRMDQMVGRFNSHQTEDRAVTDAAGQILTDAYVDILDKGVNPAEAMVNLDKAMDESEIMQKHPGQRQLILANSEQMFMQAARLEAQTRDRTTRSTDAAMGWVSGTLTTLMRGAPSMGGALLQSMPALDKAAEEMVLNDFGLLGPRSVGEPIDLVATVGSLLGFKGKDPEEEKARSIAYIDAYLGLTKDILQHDFEKFAEQEMVSLSKRFDVQQQIGGFPLVALGEEGEPILKHWNNQIQSIANSYADDFDARTQNVAERYVDTVRHIARNGIWDTDDIKYSEMSDEELIEREKNDEFDELMLAPRTKTGLSFADMIGDLGTGGSLVHGMGTRFLNAAISTDPNNAFDDVLLEKIAAIKDKTSLQQAGDVIADLSDGKQSIFSFIKETTGGAAPMEMLLGLQEGDIGAVFQPQDEDRDSAGFLKRAQRAASDALQTAVPIDPDNPLIPFPVVTPTDEELQGALDRIGPAQDSIRVGDPSTIGAGTTRGDVREEINLLGTRESIGEWLKAKHMNGHPSSAPSFREAQTLFEAEFEGFFKDPIEMDKEILEGKPVNDAIYEPMEKAMPKLGLGEWDPNVSGEMTTLKQHLATAMLPGGSGGEIQRAAEQRLEDIRQDHKLARLRGAPTVQAEKNKDKNKVEPTRLAGLSPIDDVTQMEPLPLVLTEAFGPEQPQISDLVAEGLKLISPLRPLSDTREQG